MGCLLSATCRGVAQEGMSKKEAQKKLEMEENDPTKFKENRTARMNRMRGTGAAPTPAPPDAGMCAPR